MYWRKQPSMNYYEIILDNYHYDNFNMSNNLFQALNFNFNKSFKEMTLKALLHFSILSALIKWSMLNASKQKYSSLFLFKHHFSKIFWWSQHAMRQKK